MLGSLKHRVLEGGKQLKSTLEEHSAEMNKQRLQMNINMNSASERLTAVAAAATSVVSTVTKSTTLGASAPSASVVGTKEPDEVAGGPFFASFVHRQQQANAHPADGRNSIVSLVGLMEEVEQLLIQRALGDAFAKDLHTYQTILSYQGYLPALTDPHAPVESLESIEMAIQPDEDLDTFYKDVVDPDDGPSWSGGCGSGDGARDDVDAVDVAVAPRHHVDGHVWVDPTGDDDETKSDMASTVAELPSEVPTLDGYASDTNEQDD
ncbi:hypothetical protein DYB32_002709 [Aphanomyces invadans]|uniref:Uncharacterized protein n=1 Tax=Aphanomyces invadans TaxID=157072 RepID=A0A418B2N2_9STRA|nr:hypothetical protein DYB32_002709 [Aphanomyces invadans]